MQKRPVTMALAVAGIIAGTHAGIAAISTETTEKSERATGSVNVQPESMAAVETAAPVQAPLETQAAADTQTPVPRTAELVAPAAAPAPMKTAASATSDERMVRVPFTKYQVKMRNPTFPSGSSETGEVMPSVVAYFDQKNANIVLTGAKGPVFPIGAPEISEPLPSTIAYFDQAEARRIAAAKPAAPATTAAVQAPAIAPDLPVNKEPLALSEPSTVRPGT